MGHVSWIAVTLVIELPLAILQVSLQQLAVAQFKLEGRAGSSGACLRCCASCCESCCFSCSSGVTALACVAALVAMAFWGGHYAGALRSFAAARIEAWLLWFLTDLYKPCYGTGFLKAWREEAKKVSTVT